jgi:serine/threonine protein kinase/tetratricopeptide (TPR) repeat protein
MSPECPKCHTHNPEDSKFCKECATPLSIAEAAAHTKTLATPSKGLATGSTLAKRYQIIEELGSGGMGKVYKVHDTEIKEKVALKLLKAEIASDEKTIERFRNEIRLARKITHKNVGRMFDLGKADDSYFITMEYVEGQDLKGLIRQSGQLAVGTAIHIAKQICEGLAEAHRLGVVHRDLKPGNILIDKEGNARIMDFGIARSVAEKDKEMTGAGMIIGTPVYMSPEQAEAKEADKRTDIYSLGVILYEMLTGRYPFEGDTSFIMAMKHRGEKPKDPRKLNPQIPEPLSRLILKCLDRDKEKRFQNVEDISSGLSIIKKDSSTADRFEAKPKSKTVEISKVKLRRMVFFSGAAVVIILMIVFGLIFLRGRQDVFDSIAILPFINASNSPDAEYLCDGITESLINQLSQVTGLKVMARPTVFEYKGKDVNPQQVGQELEVAVVLDGRIDRRERSLLIGVDLVNVAEGTQIWGNRFECSETEISTVEKRIVTTIPTKLRLRLSQEEMASLARRYPKDSEAYDLYLKGLHYIYGTAEEMNKALDYFQEALNLDPGFALAYAGTAEAYTIQAALTTKTRQEALPKAKAALQMALELDENLAEAHTAAGGIKYRFDWDWAGAEEEFKLGIQLNPGSSEAHVEYSIFLCTMGRLEEALREAKEAQKLDPLAIRPSHWVAATHLLSQEYEAGALELKKIIDFHPDWYWGYIKLATAYVGMKDFEKALAAAEKAEELIGGPGWPLSRSWLGRVYGKSGDLQRAEEALLQIQQMEKESHVDPWALAEIYDVLGKKEEALDSLEKAYKERSPNMLYLKIFASERFQDISSEPRYQELLRLMAFQ